MEIQQLEKWWFTQQFARWLAAEIYFEGYFIGI